jgi:hypothetical protein
MNKWLVEWMDGWMDDALVALGSHALAPHLCKLIIFYGKSIFLN